MDGLLILALETATGCGSVALTRGDLRHGRVLAEYAHFPEKSPSRELLSMAQEIMRACELDFADLDAVAVSSGPGSFTGLRIGMAAGQGFSVALGKPLVSVPTLDAIAASLPPLEMPVLALLDARKGQVYAARYCRDGAGMLQRESEYLVAAPQDICKALASEDGPICCVGPGLAACGADFLEKVLAVPPASGQPRAALVGLCAAGMLASGNLGEGLLYVRSTAAQLDLKLAKSA